MNQTNHNLTIRDQIDIAINGSRQYHAKSASADGTKEPDTAQWGHEEMASYSMVECHGSFSRRQQCEYHRFWNEFGLPDYSQFEDAMIFQRSRWPDSLEKVVQCRLSLGVTPVFVRAGTPSLQQNSADVSPVTTAWSRRDRLAVKRSTPPPFGQSDRD